MVSLHVFVTACRLCRSIGVEGLLLPAVLLEVGCELLLPGLPALWALVGPLDWEVPGDKSGSAIML